ncbi:MAG: hypothetical protein NUW37_19860 [Planctomycetes bacterium]|nr:hypothetical protein [Planctomycetota bacterium]
MLTPLISKCSLANCLVESRKEEVLQNGFVVNGVAGILIEVLENRVQFPRFKKILWNKVLFFYEPHKKKPRQKSDKVFSVVLPVRVTLFKKVIFSKLHIVEWEMDVLHCPEIPVRQFTVEFFIQKFDVEYLLPGFVKIVEAGNALDARRIAKRKTCQDIEMAAMRGGYIYVANYGYFTKNVLAEVTFIATTVYNRDRELPAVFENHHHRHNREAIDLSCDTCNSPTRVIVFFQANREEKV